MSDGALRWTRPDLLVAASLTALSILVSWPLILRSRDSARLTSCQGNMREIGMALNSYIQAHQVLPPASRWTADGLDVGTMDQEPRTGHVTFENWAQPLLPQMGQGALADQFDRSVPVTDPRNREARTAPLPILKCPSDSFNRPDNRYRYDDPNRSVEAEFARVNYAINGGSQAAGRYPGRSSAPVADGYHYEHDRESGKFELWGNGIAGINRAFAPGEFRKQRSLGPRRGGRAPGRDPPGRLAWRVGPGAHRGEHHFRPRRVRRRCRAEQPGRSGGRHSRLRQAPRGPRPRGAPPRKHALLLLLDDERPGHGTKPTPGGVNALMLDGSVRFISDAIDPTLWHVLHSRETPDDKVDADGLSVEPPDAAPVPSSPEIIANDSSSMAGVAPRALASIVNSIGMELAYIPPGRFVMGIPDAGHEAKVPPTTPPHRVEITQPYYLGVFEVTQEQFRRVMGTNPSWHSSEGAFGGATAQDTGMMPVERVSWEAAAEFCRRLSSLLKERREGRSYRLPTEAEWEYACRAGDPKPHEPALRGADPVTGENVGEHNKEVLDVVAVGSYPANGFGLHDMRGNVFEWCSDWSSRDYYGLSPVGDPSGPKFGYLRVVRGVDWLFSGEGCMINRRVSPPWSLINRRVSPPWSSSAFLGFQVAATGPSPTIASPSRTLPAAWGGRNQLVIHSSHRNPRAMELIRFDVDRRTANLIRGGWSASPSWSPGGRKLAFADAKARLVVIEADGKHDRTLTQDEFRFVKAPSWSPDGRRITFSASRDGSSWSIFVVAGEGRGEPRLVSEEATDLAMPAWSPDGSLILFVALRKGTPGVIDLSAVDPEGGRPRRVREDVPFIAGPAWSPDGGRIAFTDREEGSDRLRLVVANPDGGAHLPIAEAGVNVFPAWSPDGRSIAYIHYESLTSPRGDLMLFDMSTGKSSALSRGSMTFGEDARPSWLPHTSGGFGNRPSGRHAGMAGLP